MYLHTFFIIITLIRIDPNLRAPNIILKKLEKKFTLTGYLKSSLRPIYSASILKNIRISYMKRDYNSIYNNLKHEFIIILLVFLWWQLHGMKVLPQTLQQIVARQNKVVIFKRIMIVSLIFFFFCLPKDEKSLNMFLKGSCISLETTKAAQCKEI